MSQMPAAECCAKFRKLFWLQTWLLIGVMLFFWQPYRLVFNHTPSAELGFYALNTSALPPYRVDRMVGYKYAAPDWALRYQKTVEDGTLFLKVVGAVPGEHLFSRGDSVFACTASAMDDTCRLLGVRQRKDKQGADIPIQEYSGEKIPAGMYWLISGDPKEKWAFDSRYLGLIPAVRLTGGVSPLLTWQP